MATATNTIDLTQGNSARDASPDRAAVRVWLYVIALLIVAMVAIGGATRLTGSGLSITEWKPIHGVIPPLSDTEWQEEFAKYRQIPEYKLVNQGMTLAEFKTIFWWEWTHRFLGRFIGIAFLIPFLFFWATGRLERRLLPKLAAIFVLGGLQGAVGWWMVASGLSVRTDVSQYRLAIHLTLACAILAYVLWVARGIGGAAEPAPRLLPREAGEEDHAKHGGGGSREAGAWGRPVHRLRRSPSPAAPGRIKSLRWMAGAILGLALLQIFLGGLVAGLDAGLAFNTWPTMDGELVPTGLFIMEPLWRNFFENPVAVQFDHRLIAYLLFAAVIVHAVQAKGTAAARTALLLVFLVALQAAFGIATLLHAVPLPLALFHQLGAVAVLTLAVIHLRAITGAEPQARASAA